MPEYEDDILQELFNLDKAELVESPEKAYLDLKNEVARAFPMNKNLVQRNQINIKYDLLSRGPLSSSLDGEVRIMNRKETVDDVIRENRERHEKIGKRIVLVPDAEGNIVEKPVSELTIDEYSIAYHKKENMPGYNNMPPEQQEAITMDDQVNRAYRTIMNYYMTDPTRFNIQLQHVLPHYNLKTGAMRRNALKGQPYGREVSDSFEHNLTSEMKFQFSAIPIPYYDSSGNLRIDIRPAQDGTDRFIDPRIVQQIHARIGHEAKLLLQSLNYNEDEINMQSNMDAYRAVLQNELLRITKEKNALVDKDGRFIDKRVEAIVGLSMRFFGIWRYDTFTNEFGEQKSSLYTVLANYYEKNEGMPIDTHAQIQEYESMKRAEEFLGLMVSSAMSKTIVNNARIVVSEDHSDFSHEVTTLSNNQYDNTVSKMKDSLERHFDNGVLNNPNIFRKISNKIHKDEHGNILIGNKEDGAIFLARLKGKGPMKPMYTFWTLGKLTSKDLALSMEDASREYHQTPHYVGTFDHKGVMARQFIAMFKEVRSLIGLPARAISLQDVRSILQMHDFSPAMNSAMYDLQRKHHNNKIAKAYNNPAQMLVDFVAQLINIHLVQTTSFDMVLTNKAKDDTVTKEKRHDTLMNHIIYVKEKYGQSGLRVFTKDFLKEQLPMIQDLVDYIDRIGINHILKQKGENEYFTSVGIFVPTPSQLYSVIEVLSSQIASNRGDVTGNTTFGADKKRRPVIQGSTLFNKNMDGNFQVKRMLRHFNQNPEAKMLSPFFDGKGQEIYNPYLRVNGEKGFVVLDRLEESIGLERRYGYDYTQGRVKLNSHDFMMMSMANFFDRLERATKDTMIISVPTMTISSTGKIIFANHRFMQGKDQKGKPYYNDHIITWDNSSKTAKLDYQQVYDRVMDKVHMVEREIELSYNRYVALVTEVNKLISDPANYIPLPLDKKVKKTDIDRAAYNERSKELIESQLSKLPADERKRIIEYVQQSDTQKGKDVVVDLANMAFHMGEVASDNIKDLTAKNNLYTKENRDLLKSAELEQKGKKKKAVDFESFIKGIFFNDFKSFVDNLKSIGMDIDSAPLISLVGKPVTLQELSGKKVTSFTHMDNLNSPLFAFYMMFHLSNNMLETFTGNSMSFKGVMDQVKRMGPMNTPVEYFSVNQNIAGRRLGSLPDTGKYIAVSDIFKDVTITPELREKVNAVDGMSILNPLIEPMMAISSGGKHYSIAGNSAMLKTLGMGLNPLNMNLTELKHAAKFITEYDFNNSLVYKRMVHDLMLAQDQLLANDAAYQEAVKDTYLEGFSWVKRFQNYYKFTGSLDETIARLHKDLVDSQNYKNQYELSEKVEGKRQHFVVEIFDKEKNELSTKEYTQDEMERKHQTAYERLARSVVYGFNPESTIKTTKGSMNMYDPSSNERNNTFAFSDLDYTGMGIVNSADQPMDDSKKQSPYNQVLGMLGMSGVQIDETVGNAGDRNPGVAVSQKLAQIQRLGIEKINQRIDKVEPPVYRKANQPSFNEVDWMAENLDDHDLTYALAQLEWFMRNNAIKGLADARVKGVYIEMLSNSNVSRQVPQLRIKMLENFRSLINKEAVKVGMTGMRVTQGSGVFHSLYYLKDGSDTIAFTRQEAMKHLGIEEAGVFDYENTEAQLLEAFDARELEDMRVVDGLTKRGQVIMPYIYGQKLGLKEGQTMRDLLSIGTDKGTINLRSLFDKVGKDKTKLKNELANLFRENGINSNILKSVLFGKAWNNVVNQTEKAMIAELGRDQFIRETPAIFDRLAEEVALLYSNVEATLKVFLMRTPANGLGAGGWYDIAGFHNDGNIAYIPVGMTVLNNSDFDIDQLSSYFNRLQANGHFSEDEIDILQSDILDITEAVYMSKEAQSELFVKSSTEEIKAIADAVDAKAAPTPFNSAYTLVKSYEENMVGEKAISILVNTMSASVYLATLYERNDNIVPSMKGGNPMYDIVSDARRAMRGKESLIIMVGDWLQAARNNPKENIIGRYGVLEEAISTLGVLIAQGPRKGETNIDFLERMKETFSQNAVASTFRQESLRNSLYYSRRNRTIYENVQQYIANIKYQIDKSPFKDLDSIDKDVEHEKAIRQYLEDVLIKDLNEHFQGIRPDLKLTDKPIAEQTSLLHEIKRYKEHLESVGMERDPVAQKQRERLQKYFDLLKYHSEMEMRILHEENLQALLELDKLVVQGMALRNISRLVSLRQQLPGQDVDHKILIKELQLMFGAELQDIVYGREISDEEFIQYYLTHSNDVVGADQATIDLLKEKALRVRHMIDLREYVSSLPQVKAQLEELLREQRMMEKLFIADSNEYAALQEEALRSMGYNDWKYGNQFTIFRDTFTELVLDKYFEEYSDRRVSIVLPQESETVYLSGNEKSILANLDLSNVFHRNIFSLAFPEIVQLLQEDYASAQAMEQAFVAMNPAFRGISEAVYEKSGTRKQNSFINMLDISGNNGRMYVTLTQSTADLSEEARLKIQEDFHLLPQGLRELFLANEMIVNKLQWRKGSIADVMGMDHYKDGVSRAFDSVDASMREKGSIFEDDKIKERFLDYVALQDGMTQYVKAKELDSAADMKYLHTFYTTLGRSNKLVLRNNIDGTQDIVYNISPRAGFSEAYDGDVVSVLPYLALSGEELVQIADKDGSFDKKFINGHGYMSGYYMTEAGKMVYVQRKGMFEIKVDTRLREISEIDNPYYKKLHSDELIKAQNKEAIDRTVQQAEKQGDYYDMLQQEAREQAEQRRREEQNMQAPPVDTFNEGVMRNEQLRSDMIAEARTPGTESHNHLLKLGFTSEVIQAIPDNIIENILKC